MQYEWEKRCTNQIQSSTPIETLITTVRVLEVILTLIRRSLLYLINNEITWTSSNSSSYAILKLGIKSIATPGSDTFGQSSRITSHSMWCNVTGEDTILGVSTPSFLESPVGTFLAAVRRFDECPERNPTNGLHYAQLSNSPVRRVPQAPWLSLG